MAERLDVRQSRRRPLGSLPPVGQRKIDYIRFSIVMRQQFGLGVDDFWEPR